MIFLCYGHCSLFYHIEGICIIPLVEDDLPFFVGLGVAGGGKCVLLLFCELAEEGEDF